MAAGPLFFGSTIWTFNWNPPYEKTLRRLARLDIGNRRQLNEPEPVGESGGEIACELECKTGLAAATDAGQREQAFVRVQNEIGEGGEILGPADERCAQSGQG